MKPQSSVVFSLFDTSTFGKNERYLLSQLYALHKKGYHVVIAANNESVKKRILSQVSEGDKKTFLVTNAPYHLNIMGQALDMVKSLLVLPTALIWCDVMIKHLKKDYAHVICLWGGGSDRIVFSGISKKYKCSLIWAESGKSTKDMQKFFGIPQYLYKQAEKYPDLIIASSEAAKKSLLLTTSLPQSIVSVVEKGSIASLQKFTKIVRNKASSNRV